MQQRLRRFVSTMTLLFLSRFITDKMTWLFGWCVALFRTDTQTTDYFASSTYELLLLDAQDQNYAHIFKRTSR